MPDEYREQARRADRDVVIEVLYENRTAFKVFAACQTQWRVAGMGGVTGLDYAAVFAAMQMLKVKRVTDAFDRVRVIEGAALKEIERKRSRTKPKSAK